MSTVSLSVSFGNVMEDVIGFGRRVPGAGREGDRGEGRGRCARRCGARSVCEAGQSRVPRGAGGAARGDMMFLITFPCVAPLGHLHIPYAQVQLAAEEAQRAAVVASDARVAAAALAADRRAVRRGRGDHAPPLWAAHLTFVFPVCAGAGGPFRRGGAACGGAGAPARGHGSGARPSVCVYVSLYVCVYVAACACGDHLLECAASG